MKTSVSAPWAAPRIYGLARKSCCGVFAPWEIPLLAAVLALPHGTRLATALGCKRAGSSHMLATIESSPSVGYSDWPRSRGPFVPASSRQPVPGFPWHIGSYANVAQRAGRAD